MKSIVLDGDKIAEAIQKAKDKMINGEYDNNDLILRGDALKAIRQRCISEHLPFKSNTPVGARVLDALAAVYQVKPYKDVCGKWISIKDRMPVAKEVVLAYESAFDSMSMAFRLPDTEEFINVGDYYALDAAPRTTGGDPMTIILVIAAVCVYDLCGLLAVLYINHTDRMDTVDGADNVIALIFWPLLVVTRIGIACYRIIKRLLK